MGAHNQFLEGVFNSARTRLQHAAGRKRCCGHQGKDQQGKGFDPRKLLKPGRDNIVARTKELMEEFGSVNKA